MSNFKAAAKAIAENEELRTQILAATSSDERAKLLSEAGIEAPTHDEVNEAMMAGVDGAGVTNTAATIVKNAAPAAAAAC